MTQNTPAPERKSRQAGCRLVPCRLHTNYQLNPVGIDSTRPRLGWQLRLRNPGHRGITQKACRIEVWQQDANRGNGTLVWDSGTVLKESPMAVYEGPTLQPRGRYRWRVKSMDSIGHWSGWSPWASFTMGFPELGQHGEKWIGSGEVSILPERFSEEAPAGEIHADPFLRRAFHIDELPLRATACIASVGYHELYVNGKKVGDRVLVPSVTDHNRRARYVMYEIGTLLRPGENVIGIWLGTGWSIFAEFLTSDKPRSPITLGRFDFDYPDNRSEFLVTDRNWKCFPSPNSLIGFWTFQNFGGERYDARQEIPGWAEPGLKDSSWKKAVEFSPSLKVSADPLESNHCVEELRPVEVREIEPGTVRFDFGRHFSGWTQVRLTGKPGTRVQFYFSELENSLMTFGMQSEYIVGSEGKGVFCNRFNYNSARWVTIKGLAYVPKLADVRGWMIRTAYERTSVFACSNELLSDIWRTALWTYENLSLGGYMVDCAHRERMGYGGDGHSTTLTGLTNFRTEAFYNKWLQDWRDVQKSHLAGLVPNMDCGPGYIPNTAPTFWGGGGPAWGGFSVYLSWTLYLYTGDKQVLSDNFGMVEKWLGFLESKSSENLLVSWGDHWCFLGDWLWPMHESPWDCPSQMLFFNNCYWIYNLQLAQRIARILGFTDMANSLERRMEQVREAVRERFPFHENRGYFEGGFQACTAIALLVGLPPPEIRARVWEQLAHDIEVCHKGHLHAGITGGAMLFQLLMENHRGDLIYSMVNRKTYPSWGYMIAHGATTFWETWDGFNHLRNNVNNFSYSHSSFLFVGAWYIRGILGIQPIEDFPGFEKVRIWPNPVNQPGLDWARGSCDTIRGRIEVEWRLESGVFGLNVTIPPGITALLHLPAEDTGQITENGAPLSGQGEIEILNAGAGSVVIEVASGSYAFTVAKVRQALAPGMP